MREYEFVEWIRKQSGCNPTAVLVGPGDDAAVVRVGNERLIVTTDQLLDGTHFHLNLHGAEAAGRKAMARNLSDIAAMAAVPIGAVATVALPKDFTCKASEALYHGLRSLGDAFHCPVVGGDVGVWGGPLAVTVTVFGRTGGIEPILRSGAKVGDAVCVTGRLGGAWRSQRHLTFTPRIVEARSLAARCNVHAMIDMSDGLAADLNHLCRASGVGAEIRAEAVPIHPDANLAKDRTPLAAALGDGEDYELLFALPASQVDQLASPPLGVAVTRIGTIREGSDLALITADGQRQKLEPVGWQHVTT